MRDIYGSRQGLGPRLVRLGWQSVALQLPAPNHRAVQSHEQSKNRLPGSHAPAPAHHERDWGSPIGRNVHSGVIHDTRGKERDLPCRAMEIQRLELHGPASLPPASRRVCKPRRGAQHTCTYKGDEGGAQGGLQNSPTASERETPSFRTMAGLSGSTPRGTCARWPPYPG